MKIIIFSLTIVSLFATVRNNSLIVQKNIELIIPIEDNELFYFNKSSINSALLSIPENIEIGACIIGVITTTTNKTEKKKNLRYSILSGNTEDNFNIDENTGEICVNKLLDYEKITFYNLTMHVFDDNHDDNATINISIENINDNPPKFDDFEKEITIMEETLPSNCLILVKAYDPDITNKTANQHIVYTLSDTNYFTIDNKSGCLKIKKPLDRDGPRGKDTWQVIVNAHDEENSQKSLQDFIKININLLDINDNKPFIKNTSIYWDENQEPGIIKRLIVDDYDSSSNAGPFNIKIDNKNADKIINSRFSIICDNLNALVSFDREEKEEYIIPIIISDNGNPSMTTTTALNVIIGDVNDIKMKNSTKSVIIRNWNGNYVDLQYLFVDVNDDDDGWHLNDYHFIWNGVKPDNFDLDPRTGTITPVKGITSGNYHLKFYITEESKWIVKHTVCAIVDVSFREISKDAYLYLKNHGDNSICPEYLDC